MTQHLQFPLKLYNPAIVAAEFELQQAEFEYEAMRNMPIDELCNCVPASNSARFRAARERLHKAQDFYREARHRASYMRRGSWN